MTPFEIREIERKLEKSGQDVEVLRRLLDRALRDHENLKARLKMTKKRIDESGIKY